MSTHTRRSSSLLYSSEMKEIFTDYFNNNYGPMSSISRYKRDLSMSTDSEEMVDLESIPKYNTVRKWYAEWRLNQFKPKDGESVLENLKSKLSDYKEHTILVDENPFAVCIITPIMYRAHRLHHAKDVIFVHSIAEADNDHHIISFLLTPCNVGAVPLGVLITEGKSTEDYVNALRLLKSGFKSRSFFDQEYPSVIITDENDFERSAFQTVFPQSTLLLCPFTVSQTVLRWLKKAENRICEEDRSVIFDQFNNILVSNSRNEAERYYVLCAQDAAQKYPNWLEYLNSYWIRREDWCLAFRRERTFGIQTNNLGKVCARIFKDKMVNRFKSCNLIGLVDHTCKTIEEYYENRLRNFANFPENYLRLFLDDKVKRASYLTEESIIRMKEDIFLVPSETEKGFCYTVDPRAGFCSCYIGKLGEFCKHQAGIYKIFKNVTFANLPDISAKSRHTMAKLAFGDKTPDISFYLPLQLDVSIREAAKALENSYAEKEDTLIDLKGMDSEVGKMFEECLQLLKEKFNNYGSSIEVVECFLNRCKSIKTKTGLEKFLRKAGAKPANPDSLREKSQCFQNKQPKKENESNIS